MLDYRHFCFGHCIHSGLASLGQFDGFAKRIRARYIASSACGSYPGNSSDFVAYYESKGSYWNSFELSVAVVREFYQDNLSLSCAGCCTE